ncbi:hypothetical protein HED39_17255 [Enterococcus casseliflavus]|uniref:hypothetical protein n=1 Tax=Enterococcus casseliflavus TaxID=37734 RepID=UPI0014333A92|nr:hypothetical protein [Enterococcus casseliflavus]MCD5162441.1 hypothetical protein [Enterococcus casseliflavus]NKD31023.1 hypothetical protein [Enterococcus casseliflavus]
MKKIKGLTIAFLLSCTIGGSFLIPASQTTAEAAAHGASFYTFSYRFFGYPPKNWAVSSPGAYLGRPGTLVDVSYAGGGFYIGHYKAWY